MSFSPAVPEWLRFFGIAGCLVPAAASLGAALPYRGRKGERYSSLNHFISELGEHGVSRAAWVFNGGLIAGGLLMLPFFFWLGMSVGGIWGVLSMAAGFTAALSCSFVGIFPMNNLVPHIRAASWYFRGGLAAVVVSGLALWLHPGDSLPREAAAAPLAAAVVFAAFMTAGAIRYRKQIRNGGAMAFLDPAAVRDTTGSTAFQEEEPVERPRIWMMPFMEWLVFAATVGCFFAVSVMAI